MLGGARLGGPAGLIALSLLALPVPASESAAVAAASAKRRYQALGADARVMGRGGGETGPPAGKRPWCGPEVCYSRDGASCFERYRADYCMHIVYICMKNFFVGGDCKSPGPPRRFWPGAYVGTGAAANASAGGDQALVLPAPPPAEWSAADWAAALSAVPLTIAVAASATSRASALLIRRPTAGGASKAPLLG